MNEHSGSEHESPHLRDAAVATHRYPAPAAPLGLAAALSHLQRQVGNRAIGRYLQQRPASVQRDPGGWKPKDSPRLTLDPQIEAQIRAITAMNALTVPEHVMGGLLELNLPPMPATAPSTTPPPPAPAAPPAPGTPTGPAPGTGLMGPREGTAGDVWKAVLSDPSMGPTIVTLGERAATRAQTEFGQLSTGATVAVVTNTVAIGGGAVVMLLANPDVRKWITATLNDKIIPVPKIPGLGVQLNLSGDNIIVGLHLDVGKILPAALGFGPASATTPLGAPPNPYDSVQRRVAADRVDGDHRAPGGPVVQRDHGPPEPAAPVIERDLRPPERAAVVQRDPIPGGAAGQTTAATGGVIGLKSIDGSFQLPAGKVLSSNGARIVKTTDTNTILIQVSSEKISLKIINGIYIDAQWPVQNMRLFNVTHTLATNETTSDVRLVDDELGDGFIDMTGTARSSIAETLGTIISRTALDRARLRPPDPSNDTRQPPAPQTAPAVPKGAFGDLVPAYDPLKDENPEETLAALIANLTAMPSDGGSDVGASDVSKISLGATVVINKGFEKMDDGTGLRIAAGTPVSVMIDSGASVAQLKGAGKGAAALAAAADVKAVHISSPGFDVIKDGQRLATIDRLSVSRGQVDVGRQDVTLFGAAKEAAKTEQGSRLIFGGIGGLVESGGVPAAFGFGVANTINDGADRPTLVPGIVAGVLEAKLQAAFTEFLAGQGRTIIPGVDLGSVLGVPGAPVNAK